MLIVLEHNIDRGAANDILARKVGKSSRNVGHCVSLHEDKFA